MGVSTSEVYCFFIARDEEIVRNEKQNKMQHYEHEKTSLHMRINKNIQLTRNNMCKSKITIKTYQNRSDYV